MMTSGRRRSVSPETAARLRQFARMRRTIAGRPVQAHKTAHSHEDDPLGSSDRNDGRKGPVADCAQPTPTESAARDMGAAQRFTRRWVSKRLNSGSCNRYSSVSDCAAKSKLER